MKMMRAMMIVLAFCLSLGCVQQALASVITTPAGLGPGAQYQLIFFTNGAFSPSSPLISTYNADVQSVAVAAGLDNINGETVTWTAVASTEAVSAVSNAPQLADVYNLGGQLVAPSGTLYSGSLVSGVHYNENGFWPFTRLVWTGSDSHGDTLSGAALGDSFIEAGIAPNTDSSWLAGGGAFINDENSLYALSSVLTVPGASVPEPSTLTLFCLGALASGIARRRQRRSMA